MSRLKYLLSLFLVVPLLLAATGGYPVNPIFQTAQITNSAGGSPTCTNGTASNTAVLCAVSTANTQWAAAVDGSATAGQALGLLVNSGTSGSDHAFRVANSAGSSTFFDIDGAGNITAPSAASVPWPTVLKAISTTGQSVVSSTTLVNDNALSLTLATGKYYQLIGNVNYTNASGGTGGGFKEGFTYSGTGGILLCNESTISSGAAASFVMGNSGAVFTAANTVLQIAPNGADSISGNGVSFVCVVYGGSAGGTLQFQIAQQVSNATATIRQNGSYFTATQLN